MVSGADMTTEAALAKLSFLLARGYSPDHVRELIQQNLRGELTSLSSHQFHFSLKDSELLRTVAKALNVSSGKVGYILLLSNGVFFSANGIWLQEVKMLRQTLFPPLMCAAASAGDISSLQALQQQGGDFNLPDYDGRTPLHLACCEGHLDTVRYLLQHGASVHTSDRFNRTPLHNAIRFK